jgi:transcriptional regulator GlxA family with amidase domain
MWETVEAFRAAHPDFQLEDELFVEGGRDVMVGNVYRRREKQSG